ncbi:TonB-dependent receptor [Tamlana agarivorans]|uniref:TonB-dependent receptor n=1 Tax=Pseudotamlana agarivorans TaxID=481183 RepID=A0ACC5U9C0_9FLAO|nr:TonB-dependent receptor [Tamlana agarivorans]MBU2950919.1 TonB-dependent receptor [Tamlana agarivorans]
MTDTLWKSQKKRKRKRKGIILGLLLVSFFIGISNASTKDVLEFQQTDITGTVLDNTGVPLPGVNIIIRGTSRGTQTDFDGHFTINANKGDILELSYIGYKKQSVTVGTGRVVNVTMQEDAEALGEVVIVGYDTQTKESLVGSVTQVTPADLKIPASNLTTALAGRVPGVIAFQSSGEPGASANNADFFVRGATTFGIRQSPLILIDGIELTADDLARINVDDIESFSVFKDATATAIYGARGANGVISVTTKTGDIGKTRVSVRYETSYSQATKNIDFADPISYLKLHTEAARTRGVAEPYSQNKIDNTLSGTANPYVYPVTDWQDELLEDFTTNQRLNFNVSGGGKTARYYVSAGLSRDTGILKIDENANFNNNIDSKQFFVRANININLTETTEAVVRVNSTIDDYTGPIPTGSQLYNAINRTSPVRFPATYAPDANNQYTEHLLFGNDGDGGDGTGAYLNPYAELVRGYREYSRSVNLVQVELHQDLKGLVPGLKWRALANMNRTSAFTINRSYQPFYYDIGSYNALDDIYTLTSLNPDTGTEYLDIDQDADDGLVVRSVIYAETALNYAHSFNDKHDISGLLVGILREQSNGATRDVQLSLPSRNIGVSGRFTYNYDKRYFTEFNFGYNGSERFAKKNRFGFFPSIGAGWVISNEKFWKSDLINRVKLRGSYGVVGNDAIGTAADRFFYLSNVNLNNAGAGAQFGTYGDFSSNGVSISRYANDDITWEKSYQQNYGLEINLLNDAIQFQAEHFRTRRTDILQTRSDVPSVLGLQSELKANIGEAKSRGFELSLSVNHQFNKDWWIQFNGNYVDSKSEFTVFEEPDYNFAGLPWLSKIGQSLTQPYGLVAERLFVDEADVANSPVQNYGEVMAGDIKYTDINGDGIVSDLDIVPIGESTQPEISYGFGFSLGYKNFDISAFFQGLDRFSFFIDSQKLSPFADTDGNGDYLNGSIAENQILQAFADSHWSEDNQDIYALWPRLSTTAIQNNNQQSTWWMRDGAFMRLKSVEIGYNFEPKKGGPFGQASVRLYVNGNNLVSWSQFKLWDPELRGNGLNYPLQRVANIGIRVNL